MEKKQPSAEYPLSLETLLMGKVTEYGLPVLALIDRQRFVDDLVYLLDTKRKNIQFYPWEYENDVEPVPTPSTLPVPPAPSAPLDFPTVLDAYGIALPHNASTDGVHPTDFDPSEKQSHGRIVITMGKQDTGDFFSDIEKDHFATMKPWGYNHVSRFKIDEYTLVKGRAGSSEEEAMSELFKYVHQLADEYRKMEGEERRVKAEEAKMAKEEYEEGRFP